MDPAARALISTLAVALSLTACEGGGSSPTQPTGTSPASSPPTSPPASSPVADWSVTQRFVSVIGPDNCWVREQRARWTGAVFADLPMTVTRSGSSILLEGDFFEVNYAGTFNGSEFSASGGPIGGGGPHTCPEGVVQQMPGVSNLSGRFSADAQQMTAAEVNSYLLTSGEAVTYTWDWQARREN
jgi:hypothetical protein